MLYGSVKHCYNPIILKIFSSIISPFPVGAKLQLENGCWGVITKNNNDNAFNPELIITYDELGDPVDRSLLRSPFYLRDREEIKIKTFASNDISFVNLASHHETYHPGTTKLNLGDYEEILSQDSTEETCDLFELVYP
jgi:hypothetical protein